MAGFPAPTIPGAARSSGLDGVRDAYTISGSFRLRAIATVET